MPDNTQLNEFQEALCKQDEWDFSGVKALFFNCTLKKSPRLSHNSGLIEMSEK